MPHDPHGVAATREPENNCTPVVGLLPEEFDQSQHPLVPGEAGVEIGDGESDVMEAGERRISHPAYSGESGGAGSPGSVARRGRPAGHTLVATMSRIAVMPPKLGCTGAAALTGTIGSTQRSPGRSHAVWPALGPYTST